MKLEKEKNNLSWYKSDDLKIRVEMCEDRSILWVTIRNYNICLKLCMYDIVDRMNDDILLNVKISKKWNNHRAFEVNSNSVIHAIDYIEKFIKEWEIKVTKDTVPETEFMSDELWYSE